MPSERCVRARARDEDRAEGANEGCPLYDLMGVPNYCDVLTNQLDYALLSRFRISRVMKRWIDPLLETRGVMDADVAADIHVRLLRRLGGPYRRPTVRATSGTLVMLEGVWRGHACGRGRRQR